MTDSTSAAAAQITVCAAVSRTETRQQHEETVMTYREDYDAALAAWRTARHVTGCPGTDGTREPSRACQPCADYWHAVHAFYVAQRAQDAADSADGYEYRHGPVGREAICLDCGQAFNPCDDSDLIHLVTTVPPGESWALRSGDDLPEMPLGQDRYCGGRGDMVGCWY